jgi:hypothetical protein
LELDSNYVKVSRYREVLRTREVWKCGTAHARRGSVLISVLS